VDWLVGLIVIVGMAVDGLAVASLAVQRLYANILPPPSGQHRGRGNPVDGALPGDDDRPFTYLPHTTPDVPLRHYGISL